MTRNIRITVADAPAIGERRLRFVDGRSVVLFNVEGVIHAIDDSCPHNGASLANGRLDGRVLQCPAHGLRFDLVSGCVVGAPGMCLTKLVVETSSANLNTLSPHRTACGDSATGVTIGPSPAAPY